MDRVEVSGAGAEEGSGEETEEESGMNLVEDSGAAMTHGRCHAYGRRHTNGRGDPGHARHGVDAGDAGRVEEKECGAGAEEVSGDETEVSEMETEVSGIEGLSVTHGEWLIPSHEISLTNKVRKGHT